ncbi:MAG: cob(I)yrinic acid a,c-diamide adenosyltransferase [Pirellulaceae bacterium]
MKIYTKTGDQGETGLRGGIRVSKSSLTIEVLGSLDELNCALGRVLAIGIAPGNQQVLQVVQHDLFSMGASVAALDSGRGENVNEFESRISLFENRIDEMDAQLPELDAFIMPGGSVIGAELHWSRAVCRRTERRLVELMDQNRLAQNLFETQLVYLNRLSDLLFVMARFENLRLSGEELRWYPEAKG